MRHFEVCFIVDPVLSGDEVKSTAQSYQEMLTNEGAGIIQADEMGLRQLAYPINNRSTGMYFCIEFATESPTFIGKVELALKRDERILRFLTVKLDKYGVKYNEDKRNGKIGKKARKEKQNEITASLITDSISRSVNSAPAPPPPVEVIAEEE